MADRPSNSNPSSWILPILLLFFFPPLGIVLLVSKLLSNPPRSKAFSARHPYYLQNDPESRAGARTVSAAAATPERQTRQRNTLLKKQAACLKQLDSKGKRLMVVGGIITGLFTLAALDNLTWALRWLFDADFELFIHELLDALPMLCFIGGGAGCLWAGIRQRKKVRQFQRCLATIGKRPMVALADLSSATGLSAKELQNVLDGMLSHGLFPQGYLDYGSQRLILSSEGLEPRPAPKKEVAPPPPSPEDEILSDIRAVNDAIANEKLSDQIDRIEGITAKILEYQKTRPEKAPQLHSFLSYYLPTTLKILHAYAQLEAQGVDGENITASMERIESMMDKVVEGFEKQLDMLFQGDAMDIATDVEVLEQMLSKDGLSDTKGVHLSL